MHPSSAGFRLKANRNNNHRFLSFKTSKLLNKERVLQELPMVLNNEVKYKKSKESDSFPHTFKLSIHL